VAGLYIITLKAPYETETVDGEGNMSLEQSVKKQSTVMLTHITRNQGIYI